MVSREAWELSESTIPRPPWGQTTAQGRPQTTPAGVACDPEPLGASQATSLNTATIRVEFGEASQSDACENSLARHERAFNRLNLKNQRMQKCILLCLQLYKKYVYEYEQTGGRPFTKVITDRWTPKRFFSL